MRALVQRVSHAAVSIEGETVGCIGPGLLVFIGIYRHDSVDDAAKLACKIAKLRIFEDTAGKMNLSLLDIAGDALLISQFTLCASTQKGHRPSYNEAAPPDIAIPLYEEFHRQLEAVLKHRVPTGRFGARMKVSLENDGPVTILLDTHKKASIHHE